MSSSYIRHVRSHLGHDLLLVPSVAAVIHDSNGRLLLQRKGESEGWSLPAGGIEPGETPERALFREVYEETGLRVQQSQLLAAFGGKTFRHRYPNGDEVEYTILLFACSIQDTGDGPSDSETLELRYFTRKDMPELALPYPKDVLFRN